MRGLVYGDRQHAYLGRLMFENETRTVGTLRGAPISVTVPVQERLALVYAGRSGK